MNNHEEQKFVKKIKVRINNKMEMTGEHIMLQLQKEMYKSKSNN